MSFHSDESFVSGEPTGSDLANNSKSTSTGEQSSLSAEDKRLRLVQKETRYVFFFRLLVMLILLMAAAASSFLVYLITETSEETSFESNYEAIAEKVLESFMEIACSKMGAAGSLVVAAVAHGLSLGHSWPFITLTSFQERGATIRKLSGAVYIGMNPMVRHNDRENWEWYSTESNDAAWYQVGKVYQEKEGLNKLDDRPQVVTRDPSLNLTTGIANHIYDYIREENSTAVRSPSSDFYLPVWQTSPITKRSVVNQNRAANVPESAEAIRKMAVVFDGMQSSKPGYSDDINPITAEIAWMLSMANRQKTKYEGDIFTSVYFPIFSNFSNSRTSVGVMRIVIHWARYFQDILPNGTNGLVIVLGNGCDEPYTYQIDGPVVVPLGHGDLHDQKFNKFKRVATFADINIIEDGTALGIKLDQQACVFSISVYPSERFVGLFESDTPFLVTFCVIFVFLVAILMFIIYDRLVEHRQKHLMRKARQTHQIVASLFPKNVCEQLLQDNRENKKRKGVADPKQRLKRFLADGKDENQDPIAELYPHATVLFADIVGFTAWSSSREPVQVFILLQTVYQAFDKVAKKRKVFKVETIGDSYVAVTGLPDPQPKHAVIMARFAQECLIKMAEVARDLETTLGPDTGELMMRLGMHSGPVTAGVLRGERSRFQLFGDTVNTAARMESTGLSGKIQCSQSTAELLKRAGKEHWLTSRQDSVEAKGKGVLETFWIGLYAVKSASNRSSNTTTSDLVKLQIHAVDIQGEMSLKQERLVSWMVEILQEHIRPIIAYHQVSKKQPRLVSMAQSNAGRIPIDEVVEAIRLPSFDARTAKPNASVVEIPENVVKELRSYVAIIASSYHENPFHSFEHACHVTMSVSKFLNCIVTPEIEMEELAVMDDRDRISKQIAAHLHDYTNGLTSDPITLFAMVFSALIHDADHRGVSNAQLIEEEPALAVLFKNTSVAEQHSVSLAWELFMSGSFKTLRNFIFVTNDELLRFRQVIVNSVLATDIFDKELNDRRKNRWEKAFAETNVTKDGHAVRATVVVEYIMQASDVCHTMQHWHIYRKWNYLLFVEMSAAYKAGRMAMDPATFWYNGELNFFDNYIIPLAQKLKECNVFGVSSEECLNYAVQNREEWEMRGETIVEEMVAGLKRSSPGVSC